MLVLLYYILLMAILFLEGSAPRLGVRPLDIVYRPMFLLTYYAPTCDTITKLSLFAFACDRDPQ